MALFKKRTDRAFDTMREKNRRYLESQGISQEQGSKDDARKPVYEDGTFEKGDIPAIIISAFMVFGPILLILGVVVFLVFHFLR
ncbi:MAG: hypothetical protein II749_02755 [Clostridia bacterium]|nr:hypothetical protein [Clostridia bacterium]MBR3295834.1 hypothetical protein [Clostridia bacterium]